MSGVFSSSSSLYAAAGWTCVIPVPAETKFPPPEGYTGANGADTPPGLLAQWSANGYGNHSIALRMPFGIIGIDVDHYTKNGKVKAGNDVLTARETAWGPLPATWCSTARGSQAGPGPSRILFYRVPPQRYATKLGPDIEIIQHHHRYAVVSPSPHSDIGETYRWYGPDGTQANGHVPGPGELPELPQAWVEHLAEGAAGITPAAAAASDGRAMIAELLQDERGFCVDTFNAQAEALRILAKTDVGSRHDAMTERVYHVVLLGAEGHPGIGTVLRELLICWEELTDGEGRQKEFRDMVLTAGRKAVTSIGAVTPFGYDPCSVMRGVEWNAPIPGGGPVDGPPGPAAPPEPPRIVSPREYIGTAPFDPSGQLDQTLAEKVLERMYPALRYAADANVWLTRGPWEWRKSANDLSPWAVSELFWLMPRGVAADDPAADPDTPEGKAEIDRNKRRARFGTAGTAASLAAKMKAAVASGNHPVSVLLSDLDAEPEILWAGGVPWDLRACANGPVAAQIDPGTPHLRSASAYPVPGPTPLWDAYTRAVWPDEDMRRWALRVLSVSLTGYADKALPILRGDSDHGKTQCIALLMSVMGSYAHAADSRLMSGADRTHASIVLELHGRRLSFIDEAPRNGHQAQERLKQLTGGAHLTGNMMGKNPVTFKPTHTLVLTANKNAALPSFTDSAVVNRVRLIPCDGDSAEVISTRTAIGDLGGWKWKAEAPAVLAAMMRETALWLADPLSARNSTAPAKSLAVVAEIAAAQDWIKLWVDERTVRDEAGAVSSDLYGEFVEFCKEMGMAPGPSGQIPSITEWGIKLNELGFAAKHKSKGNFRPLRVQLRGSRVYGSSVPPSDEVRDYENRPEDGNGELPWQGSDGESGPGPLPGFPGLD